MLAPITGLCTTSMSPAQLPVRLQGVTRQATKGGPGAETEDDPPAVRGHGLLAVAEGGLRAVTGDDLEVASEQVCAS